MSGGTVSDTQKLRVDALIIGLKADGLFSIMDAVWVHAGESVSQQALIDIVGLHTAAPMPTAGTGPTLTAGGYRSEEHTSELQSLMRISYAVFCLQKQQHSH